MWGFAANEDDSIMRGNVGAKYMAFEIVWRNPVRLPKTDYPKLRRIRKHRLGALYSVTSVIPGRIWGRGRRFFRQYELVRGDVA